MEPPNGLALEYQRDYGSARGDLSHFAHAALKKAISHEDRVPEHVLREAFRWVTTSEPCRKYGAELFAAYCIRHAIEAGVLLVVELEGAGYHDVPNQLTEDERDWLAAAARRASEDNIATGLGTRQALLDLAAKVEALPVTEPEGGGAR